MSLPYLMSRQEVLDLLQISPQTLYRLHKNDEKFPQPVKIGHKKMYLGAKIEQYLEGD